jgi:hypothetical protein
MGSSARIGVGVGRALYRNVWYAALLSPLLIVLALNLGVMTGLEANSVADARIERGEDYTVNVSEPPRETIGLRLLPDWQPDPITPEPIRERIEAATIAFAEAMVVQTMQLASAVSVWTYHNRAWISPTWASWLLNSMSIATAGAVTGMYALRVRRMVRG